MKPCEIASHMKVAEVIHPNPSVAHSRPRSREHDEAKDKPLSKNTRTERGWGESSTNSLLHSHYINLSTLRQPLLRWYSQV
jgi:hypothetical protein